MTGANSSKILRILIDEGRLSSLKPSSGKRALCVHLEISRVFWKGVFNVKQWLDSTDRPIIFDGGMGTMLLASGLSLGECPELWNLTKPDVVVDVMESFVKSGSDVIQTNTFGANRVKLSNFGLQDKVKDIMQRAVRNAKRAAGKKAKVAVSIGPTGEILEPWGPFEFDEAVNVFQEQISAALVENPDLVLIETMSQLAEARAALLAAKTISSIPVIVTMTFEDNGRTTFGTSPEAAAITLNAMGATRTGVNCIGNFDLLSDIVTRMTSSIGKPILVQPNAGIPKIVGGKPIYTITPKIFGKKTCSLIKSGAALIGGCCGSTPAHITELCQHAKFEPLPTIKPKRINALASNFDALFLDPKGPITIIGEHANPSSNETVQREILHGDFSTLVKKSKKQIENGAHIIDVNTGIPGEDEALLMKNAVLKLQKNIKAPLCIDSSNGEALEEGLKHFHGRAILNSVDGNPEKLEEFLPIAKKYGAMLIALTIDEKGVETTAKQRLQIAKKIVDTAREYGLSEKDIIIDGLTLTVGAQQEYAMEAIETLRLVKQELHCLTTLGLTNISHGVPKRNLLNKTFLTMALTAGLDLPMIDPSRSDIDDIITAGEFITGRDIGGKRYLSKFGKAKDTRLKSPSPKTNNQSLYNIILEGETSQALKTTKTLLDTMAPLDIIDTYITPALTKVGEKYDMGEYFLPELLLSAEAAQEAFSILRDSMADNPLKSRGKIVIATVQGDIHDIGKNIVRVLLENHGFQVIDLGKDVPPEIIIQAAKPDVKLVGLSALMTTTVHSMEKTISLLRKNSFSGKVMVGGAVLSQDISNKIGADFYAKDALAGIKFAKEIYPERLKSSPY